MNILSHLKPKAVFKYFEEICNIPHGSENSDKISEYCVNFAKEHNLEFIKDNANNIIIYKNGSKGYENSKPVILQGHLDMVCQKTEDSNINFETDGLEIYVDGDFIKAKGSTLGADNGIAVAMIMSILADNNLAHPPIEAVFTTDEEIGMIGASQLNTSLLKSKKMINLDAEEGNILTVSCAGGSDFKFILPLTFNTFKGTKITIQLKGLLGGHSGVEIDKGRVNANILMGRILNYLKNKIDFQLISINGGTKSNAITNYNTVELVCENPTKFKELAETYFNIVKSEISAREPNCVLEIKTENNDSFTVFNTEIKDKLIYMLITLPNGIIDMSKEIEGLVETSLNLGILKTEEKDVIFHFALRSNKVTALNNLEERLCSIAKYNGCDFTTGGTYLPWEFNSNSDLQKLYIATFKEKFKKVPTVAAIHAGLECAVFSSQIEDLDCIAIGPDMFGVHTTEEKLSISSTNDIFELLCEILAKCK